MQFCSSNLVAQASAHDTYRAAQRKGKGFLTSPTILFLGEIIASTNVYCRHNDFSGISYYVWNIFDRTVCLI